MFRRFTPPALFVVLFLFCVANAPCFGQKIQPKDSIYIMGLVAKTNGVPLEVAVKYMDTIIVYSEKKHFTKGVSLGLRLKAGAYIQNNQPEKGEYYMKKSIAYSRKNKHYKGEIDMLLFSSAYYNEISRYDVAFANATRALAVATQIKDSLFMGNSTLQLGRCYFSKHDYKNAEAYYNTAITIFRKINAVPQLRDALGALASISVDVHDYKKALRQFAEVEKTAPEVPMDPFKLPHLYGNIARCYRETGKPEKAIEYYLKTLELTGQLGPGLQVTDASIKDDLGVLYIQNGKYALAEKYLNEALEGVKILDNPELYMSVYLHLSELAQRKKDYKKAYDYHVQYVTYSDSVMNQEKMKALEDLSVKYQTNEVASKNKLLERKNALQKAYAEQQQSRQNIWLISLSSVLLLLLLGGWFYYRNNRQRQAIAILEKTQIKQKLMITQMNPHFIFNSIENIRSLIHHNQNDDAVNYLGKFSRLTRQILENSNENYITLAEEVEMIENYLSIQQLLYNNKFNFSIAIEDAIDTEATFLPPMLTQPFIENAIKHGLSNTETNGLVDIRFYFKDSKLFFEVTDNGRGFDDTKTVENHKSLAMAITKERLITYTKNRDFVVHTDNIADANGTVMGAKVNFEIPYIFEN